MSFALCFPTSAQVWTETTAVPITQLKPSTKGLLRISDRSGQITTRKNQFLVYLHHEPSLTGEFLRVQTDDGNEISLSKEHLIFRYSSTNLKKKECVQAGSLVVGDLLLRVNGTNRKETQLVNIIELSTVVHLGVYAPMTASGTLIVDGFHVSCYAATDSHSTAHRVMGPLRLWYKKLYRFGRLRDNTMGTLTKVPQGIHKYAKFLNSVRGFVPAVSSGAAGATTAGGN